MKINSLRDFLAVAERGSLRAAARQLGLAQPAMTRSIQELEKELGVVLFERRAKGVVLTPMGEVFERRSLADPEVWDPRSPIGRRLWGRSLLPYALWQFVLAPSLFLPLGPLAVGSAAANSALAELITNLHTFLIIVTNHAGDDLAAFDGPPVDRADFVRRQVTGSVDCRTGGDPNDFLHGWLNYQIEHHVWPDLTMLQYRKVQPRLKALCAEHGVPYAQESVWRRLRRTTDIMTGRTSMRRVPAPSAEAVAGLGVSPAAPLT